MDLKPCPRRACRSADVVMTQQPIEDFGHHERIGFRVVCRKCATSGPWGGKAGLEGELAAADLWNGEWGR